MAKFKSAARTVMLASDKATNEKAKKKVISVDISANSAEAFDADIQVNSADIDAAMHAFEDKSKSFIKFCHREKKKLLNIFENLTSHPYYLYHTFDRNAFRTLMRLVLAESASASFLNDNKIQKKL